MKTKFVSLYEAQTRISDLVDRAAAGEEIVISKNGMPFAKLVPLPNRGKPRKPENAMKITSIAPNFDARDPETERVINAEE